jgi:Transglycosylase SLT domain
MKPNAIRLAKEVLRNRRKRADGGTDDWQSTGKLINEDDSINWGDPDRPSDFFRADKEDLRRRKEAERDGGNDEPAPPARTAEGRQMAPAPVVPRQEEESAGDAPPPRSEAPPIVQASLTTPPAAAPVAERQPLQFAPMPGGQSPAPFNGGTTQRPVADQTKADQVWQRMLVQESGNRQFRSDGRLIVSPAGAIGAAQIMPRTGPEAARLAGVPWDFNRLKTDPEYNRALGRAYYDAQLKRFGDPVLAAAAYNGGPGRVAQAMRYAERTGRPFTDFVRPETRNYVAIVSAEQRRAPLRFAPSAYAEGGEVGGPSDEEIKKIIANNGGGSTDAPVSNQPAMPMVSPKADAPKISAPAPISFAPTPAPDLAPKSVQTTPVAPAPGLFGNMFTGTPAAPAPNNSAANQAEVGAQIGTQVGKSLNTIGSIPAPAANPSQALAPAQAANPYGTIGAGRENSQPSFDAMGNVTVPGVSTIPSAPKSTAQPNTAAPSPAAKAPTTPGVQQPSFVSRAPLATAAELEDNPAITGPTIAGLPFSQAAQDQSISGETGSFAEAPSAPSAPSAPAESSAPSAPSAPSSVDTSQTSLSVADPSSLSQGIQDALNGLNTDPDVSQSMDNMDDKDNGDDSSDGDGGDGGDGDGGGGEGGDGEKRGGAIHSHNVHKNIIDRAMTIAKGSKKRKGYANEGAVDEPTIQDQPAVYDEMGNVLAPPQAAEGTKQSLYDRAMESVRQPENSRIWEGMKRGFGDKPLGASEKDTADYPVAADIYNSIAKPVGAVMRAPGAIIGGLAGAGASAYEAMGAPGGDQRLSPEARTNRLERDLFALGTSAAVPEIRPKAPTYTDAIPRGGDVLPPLPREALSAPERLAATTIEGNPAALEAPRKALPAPTVVEAAMEKVPERPNPLAEYETVEKFEPLNDPIVSAPKTETAPAPARNLSDQGFYSHASEIAEKYLPEKGTPEQMIATLKNKGASPEELKWAGLLDNDKKLDNYWASKSKVTKSEILNQLEMTPVMSETMLQGSDIRFPGSSYNTMGGGNYRELILQQDAHYPQFEYPSHFEGIYNPTGHIRMHDRIDPLLGEGLHSDEFQSDWANEARKNGFRDPEYASKVYMQRQYIEQSKSALQKQLDMVSELNPEMPMSRIYEQASVRPLVDEYKQARSDLRDMQDKHESQVARGSHISNSEDVNKLLARRFLMEAAREGKDFASFTPGKMQAERWGDPKLEETYKGFTSDFKKVLKEFDPTLKLETNPIQHPKTADFGIQALFDMAKNYMPSINGEPPTLHDVTSWWNDLDYRSRQMYSDEWKKENSGTTISHFPVVRLNDQQRANILKGAREYKRGGAVDRAMNISRFGTDAVQKAVNLARQHRGRPENS